MAEHVKIGQAKELARRAGFTLHKYPGTRSIYDIVGERSGDVFRGTLDECAIWLVGFLRCARPPSLHRNPVSTRASKWSKAYKDSLPDSAFLIIDKRGNTKTLKGRTRPLSRRHLPYKDKAGNVNLDHLRNAISRAPQTTSVPAKDRKAAQERARKLLAKIEGK